MNDTLRNYVTILRRWSRVIAAIVLCCLIAAGGFILLSPTKYQSTAVLFISTPRDDTASGYRGDLYSKERISSYVALGASTDIAARVVRDVGLDVTPAALVRRTAVAQIPGTVMLAVTTSADSPAEAQAVTTAYSAQLRRSIGALETVPGALTPRTEAIVVQPATFDMTKAGFPAWMLLGGAAGFGLILGCLVAVIISLLDGRVRRAVDTAEATGYPVLAEFPAAIDRVAEESDAAAGESARLLRTALDRLRILGRQIVLITSAEPGAGKTSVALMVCRVLADRGNSVVLVDFDSRGSHLGTLLAVETGPTVVDFISGFEPVLDVDADAAGGRHRIDGDDIREEPVVESPQLRRAATWNGVTVLPFGPKEDNPGATADDPRLSPAFAALREQFDWIVIDTPAAVPYSEATRLAPHSDSIVLVTRAGRTGFDQLRHVANDLTRAGGDIAGVAFIDDADPAPAHHDDALPGLTSKTEQRRTPTAATTGAAPDKHQPRG